MGKFRLKKTMLIIALAILPFMAMAQNNDTETPKKVYRWYTGIEGGVTMLFSDNTPYQFNDARWDVSWTIGYNFAKFMTVYGKLGYFTLAGEKANMFTLDHCDFFNANINLGIDLMQVFKYKPDRFLGITPHVGYGQMHLKAKSTMGPGNYRFGPEIKWGYDEEGGNKGNGISGRRIIWEIPLGINVSFNFSKRFTAYIDVVSVSADTERLDACPTGDSKDWYAYANVGLKYKFNWKRDKADIEPEEEQIEEPIDETPVEEENQEEETEEVSPVVDVEDAEEIEPEEVPVVVPTYKAHDIKLKFSVGKATIARTQENNSEIDKIGEDIANGRVITSITAIGYASPEGGATLNDNLAKERAQSTVAYIKERLGEKARGIKFETEGRGADWNNFYAALESSNLTYKDEVINELKGSANPSATLKKLATKYPSIKNFYSELRRTEVIVK